MIDENTKLHWYLYSFQVNGSQFVAIPCGTLEQRVTNKNIENARIALETDMIGDVELIITNVSYLGLMSREEFYL